MEISARGISVHVNNDAIGAPLNGAALFGDHGIHVTILLFLIELIEMAG